MPPLSHFEDQRHKNWCAAVVLVAVCSLIVSVATRYSSSGGASSTTVKAVQIHASPEAKRQRLAKDAADWMPPVIRFSVLQAPTSYPRIAPAGPRCRAFVLKKAFTIGLLHPRIPLVGTSAASVAFLTRILLSGVSAFEPVPPAEQVRSELSIPAQRLPGVIRDLHTADHHVSVTKFLYSGSKDESERIWAWPLHLC